MDTPYSEQIVPAALIVLTTFCFFAAERKWPGRQLPPVRGWYMRAGLMNVMQIALIGLGGITWNTYFRSHSLFQLGGWRNPVLEGCFYWFVGTFVFYWWHRLRHADGFWLFLHQIHHSPSRIELLTSFYKHPVEIAADSILTGLLIYCVFGGTAEAGAWTSFFGAAGEYFYHSNIRTPTWIGYFLQRPEHHSIHHEIDVHRYNFGDITWWDRLFGTFKDTDGFSARCGFPSDGEQKLWSMMRFKDTYR